MSDFVKELRKFAELEAAQSEYREAERHICWKAADRIEELEDEICSLHNPHSGEECDCDVCQIVKRR